MTNDNQRLVAIRDQKVALATATRSVGMTGIKQYIIGIPLIALCSYLSWTTLMELSAKKERKAVIAAISQAKEFASSAEGIERIEKFILELNKIEFDSNNEELVHDFEQYRALWNKALHDYRLSGEPKDLGKYDKEIQSFVAKLSKKSS